ncbi:MAG: hypothetical protein ACR2PL_06315 [Dehalococcoidia bacterium]
MFPRRALLLILAASLPLMLSSVPIPGVRVIPSPALAATAPPQAPAKARAQDAYGHLPLSFEVNEGQTDGSVDFLARGSGYSLFLSGGEATLALRAGVSSGQPVVETNSISQDDSTTINDVLPSPLEGEGPGLRGKTRANQAAKPLASSPSANSLPGDPRAGRTAEPPQITALKMRFPGANLTHYIGADPLPGIVNYFIGNDPAQWYTNIHTYAKVRYQNVYPGIDLVYYGDQGQLEYGLAGTGADDISEKWLEKSDT